MNTNKLQHYENPSVTVDILIFTVVDKSLKILLTKRSIDPFNGMWSLPGGFVEIDESLEEAANRVLKDKAGVKQVYMEQLYTFGETKRDPRSRIITVSYFALIPFQELDMHHLSRVSETMWCPITKLPQLAFDHKQIIAYGIERLKAKTSYSNIVFGLLPKHFRLSQLQEYYEIILGEKLDKRNFRKKILSMGFLEKTGLQEIEGAHRPAMLYKFKNHKIVTFNY